MSVLSRLARLQVAAESAKNGKIAVIFRDGTVKLLDGGACIDLVMSAPDAVEGFEARGKGNGLLPDLLNDLLN